MKQKNYLGIPIIFTIYSGFLYTNVQPIMPGEALYGVVGRIGQGVDEANSAVSEVDDKVDDLTTAVNNLSAQDALIYNAVSQIDTALQNLSGSNLEEVSSRLDVIKEKVIEINSFVDQAVPQLESVINTFSSEVDELSAITSNLSSQDALIYDTVTKIDSKVDALGVAVNNLSAQDVFIYNTVSQIDTQLQNISGSNIEIVSSLIEVVSEKLIQAGSTVDATVPQLGSVVDVLNSAVDVLNNLGNNLSAQDALIYDTVTQIDSKIDALALSTLADLSSSIYDTVTALDTKVNNLSAQDALIYDTVTEVDSKIDALDFGAITSVTNSIYDTVTTLDTKVNNLSAQDALIYDTVTEIDSKIDLLKGYPDFVQGPTNFTSVSIASNTSRYFYQSALLQTSGTTEVPILTIRNNSGSTVARISALGGGVVQNPSGMFAPVKFYKNVVLIGASFSSISGSVMEKDTSATLASFTPPVFQVANVFSAAGGACELPLTFIPKESYSITIQPGETLTATVQGIGTSSVHQAIMLWEEIIVA